MAIIAVVGAPVGDFDDLPGTTSTVNGPTTTRACASDRFDRVPQAYAADIGREFGRDRVLDDCLPLQSLHHVLLPHVNYEFCPCLIVCVVLKDQMCLLLYILHHFPYRCLHFIHYCKL